jgi:hypothetical protein
MSFQKTNFGLNLATLAALLIALVVGGVVAVDIHDQVQTDIQQSRENNKQIFKTAAKLNNSYDQILSLQEANNKRGNTTLTLFRDLIGRIDNNSNESLYNQEHYFKPYFNETFSKIFKALNISSAPR